MIFIFTDPGVHGAISAVNENEQILFSVGLVDGLPPEGFDLKYAASAANFRKKILQFRIEGMLSEWLSEWLSDCHFGIEIADWKNAEMIKAKINLNTVYKAGINTGKIIQWFTERGVRDMIEVKPREWQTIYKGFAGKDSKERAFNCLKEKYCEFVLRKHAKCKDCYTPCPLKKHGIIGPRGGYVDGKGDSLCGAIHLKNTVKAGICKTSP